jgi:hypothetical protein
MRQVYEVLRLKWASGLSDRQIAQSLGLSRPTIADYVHRAQAAGLLWPLPEALDETALEQLLFPSPPVKGAVAHQAPDWAQVHQELKRNEEHSTILTLLVVAVDGVQIPD